MKRVLISRKETESKITQIAVTELTCHTKINEHTHPDMDEYFYIMKGGDKYRIKGGDEMQQVPYTNKQTDKSVMTITIDGSVHECTQEDIIYVPAGSSHALEALSDITIMTIGVER
ncbi:MAG: hypothetical protein NC224_05195 [Bacteroides sp.]|nr:hypothetical protein [Bacteroides sp.]